MKDATLLGCYDLIWQEIKDESELLYCRFVTETFLAKNIKKWRQTYCYYIQLVPICFLLDLLCPLNNDLFWDKGEAYKVKQNDIMT